MQGQRGWQHAEVPQGAGQPTQGAQPSVHPALTQAATKQPGGQDVGIACWCNPSALAASCHASARPSSLKRPLPGIENRHQATSSAKRQHAQPANIMARFVGQPPAAADATASAAADAAAIAAALGRQGIACEIDLNGIKVRTQPGR